MTSFFASPAPRNAAVRIVAPDAAYSSPTTPKGVPGFSSPKKDSTQRQCRNIMIHGYCKFEGKGCTFQHPSDTDINESQIEEDAPRLSADAALFTPFAANPPQASTVSETTEERPTTPKNDGTSSATSATFPVQAVNAPVFVPTRSVASPKRSERNATVYSPPPSDDASATGYEYDTYGSASEDMGDASFDGMVAQIQMDQLNFRDYGQHVDSHAMLAHDYDYNGMAGMDPYFHSQHDFLNYHLYTDPTPSNPGRKFFIPDTLREDLQKRAEQIHLGPSPNIGMQLPEDVQGYHSLVPLEMTPSTGTERDAAQKRKGFGLGGSVQAILYKATKASDGKVYALRRIENYRLMNEHALGVVEKWAKIQHPGIVTVHEAFTTRAFGDSSLVVVYDYHPSAQSLAELYFRPPGSNSGHTSNGYSTPTSNGRSVNSLGQGRNTQLQAQPDKVSEATLWSYIFQLASAVRTVHEAGLALRVIDPSKVIRTGQNRVRISCCSLLDVFEADARQEGYIQAYQQEDLIMLAKLILTVACGNPMAVNNVHKALDHVHRFYPGQIKDVVHLLMKSPGPHKSIQTLFDTFGGRLVNEVDEAYAAVDKLEGELMGELENARLVRLLCKFGFINERPEFDRDTRWSETGDRYILKLFRDFVFHSVDEQGNPVVNLGHVLTHLNKLDAGSEERLMLVSRDEQSCLVVTYKEIKNCVESAFNELSRK